MNTRSKVRQHKTYKWSPFAPGTDPGGDWRDHLIIDEIPHSIERFSQGEWKDDPSRNKADIAKRAK